MLRQIAAKAIAKGRQPVLAVIYDRLARAEWADMDLKCPQSFKVAIEMARQDDTRLSQTETEFDVTFKVGHLFHFPETPTHNARPYASVGQSVHSTGPAWESCTREQREQKKPRART